MKSNLNKSLKKLFLSILTRKLIDIRKRSKVNWVNALIAYLIISIKYWSK